MIWHLQPARPLATLKGHTRPITCGLLTKVKGEPLLVTGSADKSVRLWNPDTAEQLKCFDDLGQTVLALVDLGNGLLCSGGKDLSVWDLCTQTLAGRYSPMGSADFEEDIQDMVALSETRIVVSSNGRKLAVYDVVAQGTDAPPSPGPATAPGSGEGSSGATRAEAGSAGGGAVPGTDWRANTAACPADNDAGSRTAGPAAGTPGGDSGGDPAGTAPAFAPQLEFKLRALLDDHREAVTAMHRMHAREFATGSLDGTIIVWSSETMAKLQTLNVKDVYQSTKTHKYIYSVQQLLTVNSYLIAAIGDGFSIFDAQSCEELATVPCAHRAVVTSLLAMDNGTWLLTSSADAGVRLWSLTSIRRLDKGKGKGSADSPAALRRGASPTLFRRGTSSPSLFR